MGEKLFILFLLMGAALTWFGFFLAKCYPKHDGIVIITEGPDGNEQFVVNITADDLKEKKTVSFKVVNPQQKQSL